MSDEYKGKRKVRTRDGHIGVVMSEFAGHSSSIQIRKGGFYPVYKNEDLEDITEDEFLKGFK